MEDKPAQPMPLPRSLYVAESMVDAMHARADHALRGELEGILRPLRAALPRSFERIIADLEARAYEALQPSRRAAYVQRVLTEAQRLIKPTNT